MSDTSIDEPAPRTERPDDPPPELRKQFLASISTILMLLLAFTYGFVVGLLQRSGKTVKDTVESLATIVLQYLEDLVK